MSNRQDKDCPDDLDVCDHQVSSHCGVALNALLSSVHVQAAGRHRLRPAVT